MWSGAPAWIASTSCRWWAPAGGLCGCKAPRARAAREATGHEDVTGGTGDRPDGSYDSGRRGGRFWSAAVKKGRLWLQGGLVGILGVAVVGSTLALTRPDYSFFDPLVSVKMLISQRYVTQPDEKAMQAAAIQGMVESLNDPYTVYVPP